MCVNFEASVWVHQFSTRILIRYDASIILVMHRLCAVAFHEHQNTPAVRANLDLSFLQRVHTRVTEREEVCFDAANVTSNERPKRGLGGDERVNKGDFLF